MHGIIGVGIDLVEIARIRRLWEEQREHFLNRICLASEQAYIRSHTAHPWERLAGIFAAKEATSKALGTGIGEELGWLDMEVTSSMKDGKSKGPPMLHFHGKGLELARKRNVGHAHISISHTELHATAICILTLNPQNVS